MLGFTYNGTHSSEFGLYYIPDAEDQWFNDPEYDVYGDDIPWRNGGYYYGSKAKPRTFNIKCYFEEMTVTTRQLIKQWVKMGTSGRLVFDDKPFMYWIVHPASIPIGSWYLDTGETHSGTVTISFVAHEPFAYLTRKYNPTGSQDDGASDYCNLMSETYMPDAPTTTSTSFDVYNPGTEECGLSIDISGTTSNPFRFINMNNQTSCSFIGLPPNGAHVYVNGDTGYAGIISAPTELSNGFLYHDKGIVRLDFVPGLGETQFQIRGYTPPWYHVSINKVVNDWMSGATLVIYGLADTTFKVLGINKVNNVLYCGKVGSSTPPATGVCAIYKTNHIVVEEYINNRWTTPSTLSLSTIKIDYNPRVL